jgi:uncharacterized protein YacL
MVNAVAVLATAVLLAALLKPVSTSLLLAAPLSWLADAGSGVLLALLVMGAQALLSRLPSRVLLGGLGGAILGAVAARVLWSAWPIAAGGSTGTAARTLISLALVYAGASVAVHKVARFRPAALREFWSGAEPRLGPKLVDTSVIIDGRIHDVIEAGFLDGRLLIPQFVLRELQQVADSSDSLKRARGRKGLETLQAMKKFPSIQVEVTETDFPDIREVDLKLIELARRTGGKIITNDFNLNKVARVRDIAVLNINELANALKPVVLPGEPMRVFIIKEGKEPNQGVAYLDDGTMVVVDDGKALMGQTVDIVVTSVLQTTAGARARSRLAALAQTRSNTNDTAARTT